MINDTLHLFVKFHEEGSGEFKGIKTMEEHLNVLNEKGKVVWGHFTSNPTKKGLWDERVKIIQEQMKIGEDAFVFFCDRENGLLYVGKYIDSYKRAEVERNHPIVEYIPQYYHHKVGTPNEYIENELRSYAYIELYKITKIDMDITEDIYIYSKTKDGKRQKVLDNKGMSSIMYVNIDDNLYNEFKKELEDTISMNISVKELEAIEEIEYQNQIENIDVGEKVEIEDKSEKKPEAKTVGNNKKWPRSAKKAKNAIVYVDYTCEIDSSHKYFICDRTKKNYVEAHHLIPMEFQHEFDVSLDVEANIVSLCPVCHKKLHHSTFEEKKQLLKEIYNHRKERLQKCDIEINLKQIYSYYK